MIFFNFGVSFDGQPFRPWLRCWTLLASCYNNFEAHWFRNWKLVLLEIVKDGALLWFLATTLSDWLKLDLASLSRPIRSKTKTNRWLFTHVFPSRLHLIALSFDWFAGLSVSSMIGQRITFILILLHTFINRSKPPSILLKLT